MALEVANYPSQLVPANPPGTDNARTTDDHLRVIKNAIYNAFQNINGPVNCTPAQLNGLVGLTANKILTTNGSSILASSSVDASALLRISNTLTASRALVSDGSGYVSAAAVTATELGYVSGVTSAIQTQINGKAPSAQGVTNGNSHDHDGGDGAQIPAGGLASAAVTQAKLQTATVSYSGSLSSGTRAVFAVSGYAFFPMVYGGLNGSDGVKMCGHSSDGGSADEPRFGLINNYVSSLPYAIDWRYVDA